MFFVKEPSADESYQVGGLEGYRESPLPSNRQDRISNNGKCNLVITPAYALHRDRGHVSLFPHSPRNGVWSYCETITNLMGEEQCFSVVLICNSLMMSEFDSLICLRTLMSFFVNFVHFFHVHFCIIFWMLCSCHFLIFLLGFWSFILNFWVLYVLRILHLWDTCDKYFCVFLSCLWLCL